MLFVLSNKQLVFNSSRETTCSSFRNKYLCFYQPYSLWPNSNPFLVLTDTTMKMLGFMRLFGVILEMRGGHKIQPEFENPYLVASKQILGIAYNRCFQTSLDKWALFFCTWPQQSSLSLQTEMNQTCSGCSDYSANYLENAASGASGAFGHFTGNHVILRTF